MKLERKNLSQTFDTSAALTQLERTMLASIALMKRLRRQRRRLSRPLHLRGEQRTAQPQ
jgi:hypothetical protein